MELQEAVTNAVREQEAVRCRVLETFENDDNDFTLVAVEPPDPRQVEEIREKISQMTRQCPKQDAEAFDRFLTELLKNHDPYGQKGKRAFFVTISKGSPPIPPPITSPWSPSRICPGRWIRMVVRPIR